MSHFTVIVIGGFIEQQLAPYDESISVSPYFTEESGWYVEKGKELAKERDYDPDVLENLVKALNEEYDDESPFCIVDGKFGRMTTYNPNSKWDWYTIGGRWRGFFPLKPGIEYNPLNLGESGIFEQLNESDYAKDRRVDIAQKCQIDFESARNSAEQDGRELFKKWRIIFQEHGKPKSWESIRESNENIHFARELYGNQPAIIKARDELRFFMSCPVELIGFDEEAYIQKCRNSALVPYAIVKNGEWYAQGEMGWWGMSNDDMTNEEWSAKIQDLYQSLSDETLLTLVDCHI